MDLIRSISGIRGIIDSNINTKIVARYARAFCEVQQSSKPVIIGRDTRKNGLKYSNSIKNSIKELGIDIIDIGITPTPVIQYLVKTNDVAGGIMITASHNPEEWNGLKFIDNDGCFLDSIKNNKLFTIFDNNISVNKKSKKGTEIKQNDLISIFVENLLKLSVLDIKKIRACNFNVVVDSVNGANYKVLPMILKNLNCNVKELFCDNSGKFERGPEPIAKNLSVLANSVKTNNADIGFATDPDGDRLSIVDEKGNPAGEENTLVLCADSYYNHTNSNSPLITNLSSTMNLDFIAEKNNVNIFRSPVGEANVIELMKLKKADIGGEGNGGVILNDLHLGRDSLVAAAMVLNAMAKNNKTISNILNQYPECHMTKEQVSIPKIDLKNLFNDIIKKNSNVEINEDDGLKLIWHDKWVHIRSSNTEPILRIIAESNSQNKTKTLINLIKKYILEFSH